MAYFISNYTRNIKKADMQGLHLVARMTYTVKIEMHKVNILTKKNQAVIPLLS